MFVKDEAKTTSRELSGFDVLNEELYSLARLFLSLRCAASFIISAIHIPKWHILVRHHACKSIDGPDA